MESALSLNRFIIPIVTELNAFKDFLVCPAHVLIA